jgi:hypothetical protein
MLRRLALTLLLVGPLSSVNLPAKSFHAERFDVEARLSADRSLRVEESVVFVFRGGDFTKVWREIPARRTDGIVDVVARMDGVALSEGRDPGQVEIKRGSRLRVTWHLAPTRGTHTFSLSYRLLGLAARAGDHDEISWIAMPDEHGYQIDAARVTLRVPPGAALASTIDVRPRSAEVLAGADGVTVTTGRLGDDSTIRIGLGVDSSAFAANPPLWQVTELERLRRGPYVLLVAGATLLAGLGWLAAFSSGWSQPRNDAATRPVGGGRPDPDLPAAVASRLVGRGGDLQRLTATLLELAERGVVRFEERPSASRLLGRNYEVVLVGAASSPRPHERAALALLFGSSRPGSRVSWRRAQQRVSQKGRRFGAAVLETMRHYGYVDVDRLAARRTLVRVLVFAAVLLLASLALAPLLFPMLGGWIFAVPASLALVVTAYGLAIARFSVLTPRGERDARAWRTFFASLSSSATAKESASPTPAAWLAGAVAIGVGHLVAKRMHAGTLPPWFRSESSKSADLADAFTALLATTASDSGGHAAGAGAAAAGAAGGGSSGAS